jgi:hypothetical protein
MEDLEDDRWLGNEPDDTHPLAATAEKRVDLVDASDELGPRFPADRKPGTVRSRRIGRLVLRRYREEDFAPACDSTVGVRVGAVVMDELGSPVGNVGSEAGDPFQSMRSRARTLVWNRPRRTAGSKRGE